MNHPADRCGSGHRTRYAEPYGNHGTNHHVEQEACAARRCLYAVIISIFFTLMAGTNDSNPGIIAYFDHTVMAFWSFVLMVPVAMRRWKPQMATLLFASGGRPTAFGPSMVYAT